MFGNRSLPGKKPGIGWWSVPIIVGLGLLFLLLQFAYQPPALKTLSPTATPKIDEGQPQRAAEDNEFLADYDSTTDGFLESTLDDERPLWQLSGELFLKLVLVIGLAYLALAGLRWLQKSKHSPIAGSATINVLETTGLAPGRALHLVIVGEKTLLIGATDHQISLITELADTTPPMPAEGPTAFDETLNRHVAPEQAPVANESTESAADWQATLDSLWAGICRIRELGGG